jgi:uncharacterized protein with HEPN domain
MYKSYEQLLRFMLDECLLISQWKQEGLSYEQLITDEAMKRAVVKALENIGEAGSKIPHEQRELWNNIQWRDVIGMRQRLVHDYWGVDYKIVWNVIQHKIPDLQQTLESYLC